MLSPTAVLKYEYVEIACPFINEYILRVCFRLRGNVNTFQLSTPIYSVIITLFPHLKPAPLVVHAEQMELFLANFNNKKGLYSM